MSRRIRVGALSRIEGEGGLKVQFDATGRVSGATFNIHEAPRFFEAFCWDAATVTPRILRPGFAVSVRWPIR